MNAWKNCEELLFSVVLSCTLIILHSSHNSYLCDVSFIQGDTYAPEIYTLEKKEKCNTPLFLEFCI